MAYRSTRGLGVCPPNAVCSGIQLPLPQAPAGALIWDSTQGKFVTGGAGIATGCWDQASSSYLPMQPGGCNSQVLYTSNGVLPAGSGSLPASVPVSLPQPISLSYAPVVPVGTTVYATAPGSSAPASVGILDSAMAWVSANPLIAAGAAAAVLFLVVKK